MLPCFKCKEKAESYPKTKSKPKKVPSLAQKQLFADQNKFATLSDDKDETPEDDNDITLSSVDEVFINPGSLNPIVNSAINRIKKRWSRLTHLKLSAGRCQSQWPDLRASSRVKGSLSNENQRPRFCSSFPSQDPAYADKANSSASPEAATRSSDIAERPSRAEPDSPDKHLESKAQEIASTSTVPAVGKETANQASNAQTGLVLGLQNPENECSSKTANAPWPNCAKLRGSDTPDAADTAS
ncbi:unnamed protein product [Bemisia tabaci]|uniref:Uncharacterized protein n=1 Tax=Bemisia tabaci TaxID=7038 RepID=A0A9P0A688_BEMTA|nr:unnamed protein product [Bemisia tabaci]